MLKQFFSGSAQGAKKVANLYKPSTIREKGWIWRSALLVGTLIAAIVIAMFFFSGDPATISPREALIKYLPADKVDAEGNPKVIKTGATTTAMTIYLIDSLQDKSGGYLSNDVTPPGILMDNMPAWEYGVLRNLRDISKVFRNNFSTSGSQTKMDKDLAEVENKLSIDSEQWMFPSPEASYDDAARALQHYLNRIIDDNDADAQFYARADNLRRFFRVVSPNLGSYSQRLSESVGIEVENMALAGDKNATQTTDAPGQLFNKTRWYKVDNNFYEARGYAWALLQEMRALQVDFKAVLEDKNATVYVQQLIRELEATQKTVWSPVILNGNGFGVMTNHSLVMASYFSRANAILIELTALLERG
ncbi:MAG: hypothetical protein CR975_02745 [Gammaproteobacteria bacterium]|nr:MAG: hypothetical protein CR975_02745 [Gammaproteobacteria bacterium]